jgi:hypothetical protein
MALGNGREDGGAVDAPRRVNASTGAIASFSSG